MCHFGLGRAASGGACLDEIAAGGDEQSSDDRARLQRAEIVQQQYAKAEGTYRAARALVLTEAMERRESDARSRRSPLVGTRQPLVDRLAMARMLTWVGHDGRALSRYKIGLARGSSRRQRCSEVDRDMHAEHQHIVASPPVYGALGRELAGLATVIAWMFLDLVPGT
jgi:hypothetical protein